MKRTIVLKAEENLRKRHQKLNENLEKNLTLLRSDDAFQDLNFKLKKLMIENAKSEAYGEKVDSASEEKLKAQLKNYLNKKNIDLSISYALYIDGKMCACLKKEISNLLLSESNFGELFSFEKARKTAPKEYQKLYDKMKEWCHGDFKKNLIFISGEVGVGKTYLTKAIASELIENGRIVKLVTAFQMSRDFKKYRFEYDEEILDKYVTCEFLFIDDLGTETIYKGITVELLFHVINERKMKKLCTIITSNLTLSEIGDRYDERIFSRIVDRSTSIAINLSGKD